MSYYVGLPLMFILALTEAAVLPKLRIAGLQPNLVLVVLVAWLTLRGASEAFILIPFAGLCLGLVDGAPLGTALLALAPLAIIQDLQGSRLHQGAFVLTIVFVVVMTLAYHLVYFAVYTAAGHGGSVTDALTQVIVPTTLLNITVLLPAYVLISMSAQERRRAAYV